MDVTEADAEEYSKFKTGRKFAELGRNTSTLLCGATRSGKSEGAKLLGYQLLGDWTRNEPLLAYDRKTDWQRFFDEEGVDFEILSADPDETTVYWDMFGEVETERDLDRIARALFEKPEADLGDTDEFFSTAGRQVFSAICKHVFRSYSERGGSPRTDDLIRYIRSHDRRSVYEDLQQHDDLRLAAQSLDPEAERTAVGVWANLTQEIQDVFVGSFRSPPDEADPLTLREYFENPRGRALVLSHPYGFGDETERIYSYLVDDAVRRGMSRDGGAVLLLDELPQLPKLDNLEELVNVGAGEDVRMLATIQSVSQVRDTYGDDAATSLLAGMPTQILLRSGDPETTEYYQSLIGRRYEEVETRTYKSVLQSQSVTEEERHPFTEEDLTTLSPGECIVNRPDGWIHGRITMINDGGRERIDKQV